MQYDEHSEPYKSQRNAAWRAYVSQSYTDVFARLAAQGVHTSNSSARDVSHSGEEANQNDSVHDEHVMSDSDAARLREQVLVALLAMLQITLCNMH